MPGELLRVDVGDLTVDVRASRPEDGRPVLLLHGFPQTSLSWAAVTPLLAGAGLRCQAPDQLGYAPGARPADGRTGVPEAAADEYVAVLSAPGALTAAFDWYRAMSGGDRVEPVHVPTTHVWSSGDIAIGRTAAEACAGYVTGDFRFVELPGSHWIPEQATEELARAVLDRIAPT